MTLKRALGGVIAIVLSLFLYTPSAFAAATGSASCTTWSFNAGSIIKRITVKVDGKQLFDIPEFSNDGQPHNMSGKWDLGPGEHKIVMRDWTFGDLSPAYNGKDKTPEGHDFFVVEVKCDPIETTTTSTIPATTTTVAETTTIEAPTTTSTIPETTTSTVPETTTTSTLLETTTSTIAHTTTSVKPTTTTEAPQTTVTAYPSSTVVIATTTTVSEPTTTLATSTLAPSTSVSYDGIDISKQELAATGIEVWQFILLGVVLGSLGLVAWFAARDRKEIQE